MRAKSLDSWYNEQRHALYKRYKAGMLPAKGYFAGLSALRRRYMELKEHGCRYAPES